LGDANSVALWQNNDRRDDPHLNPARTATEAQTGLPQQDRPGQRRGGAALRTAALRASPNGLICTRCSDGAARGEAETLDRLA
jgi:hypothetical protein